MVDIAEMLLEHIGARTLRVGVIGLGYVGLPLALAFCEAGFVVTGFDTDPGKIDALRAGTSYIHHIGGDQIARHVAAGLLKATQDFGDLGGQHAIIVCVPTPLTKHRDPDMRFVASTGAEISRHLLRGQLVVLESTTYPGTTDELLRSQLDASGLTLGRDYLLAFSPEREDPGNARFETRTIPKLVGGVDEASGRVAAAMYGAVVREVVRVNSARVAEAAKLTENIFRGVNIALVNELKMAFDRMGIDIWEVLDAASTKPFGYMRFDPGPGWGGHCIPVDPFYLAWKAREYDFTTKFIELAGEVNVRMPEFVVNKLQSALNDDGKAMRGARVLLLGVAYKANIDDCRESPAFPLIDLLAALGAQVCFHDPLVPQLPRTRAWPHLENRRSEPLTAELLDALDAVVLVTAHRDVDYALVARHAAIVVDTRGKFRGLDGRIIPA